LNTPADFSESGQINAYFRWKNDVDTQSDFAIQLWIAHPSAQQAAAPDSATADVTLRRLQHFQTLLGKSYIWQLSREGRIVASGNTTLDTTNLLTIPHLTLTTMSAEFSVRLDVR
jgi:hypothetical protein